MLCFFLSVCDLVIYAQCESCFIPALPIESSDLLVTMMYSLSTYKLFLSQYYLLLTFNKILKLIFHCRLKKKTKVCLCYFLCCVWLPVGFLRHFKEKCKENGRWVSVVCLFKMSVLQQWWVADVCWNSFSFYFSEVS